MMGAEESGGFGFGMHLPERDGIYADLLLLDLFLREKAAGRWPVSKAIAHFHEIAGPSFYRRIDVHVDRAAVPGDEAPAAGRPARAGPDDARRPRRSSGPMPLDTNDGFKFFLADGSWLLVRASGHRAARARLHGGHLGRARATRCSPPASGWSAARDRATTGRPARRRVDEAVGPRADLGRTPTATSARSSSSRPASGSRSSATRSRTSRSSSCPAGCGSTLEDDDGEVRVEELGPGRRAAGSRPAGSIATRRSSGVELIEVSTPELDDVVRLEDDFGREGTSAP